MTASPKARRRDPPKSDGAASVLADVLVIGGGPAGLAAADAAARAGARVVVAERMPSVGRKFLMAGKSGLNLTNAAPIEPFLAAYDGSAPPLDAAIRAFPQEAVRAWAAELGQETFVGSGGRVFPTAMKASPLLRAWLARMSASGVEIRTRWRWVGWKDGACAFETPSGPARAVAGATVLALGGASWPRLGSDGAWADALAAQGLPIEPFFASNVAWRRAWPARFLDRFEGAPIKPVALLAGGARFAGELTVTRLGLEGGALYAAGPALRRAGGALALDLAPTRSHAALAEALSRARRSDSLSQKLRKAARLAPVKAALLREAGPPPTEPAALAARIKAAPTPLLGPGPLDRAISSGGGLAWGAFERGFRLRGAAAVYAAGEMIAWDAPTGGYLLTAALAAGFSAGRAAAEEALSCSTPASAD